MMSPNRTIMLIFAVLIAFSIFFVVVLSVTGALTDSPIGS
jgi:hypothetical protein